MSVPVKLKDGTVVWVRMKPGAVLTEEGLEVLTAFVQTLREQHKAKEDKHE